MGFLSIPLPVTKSKVEEAAARFIDDVKQCVIIRSGAMGAYALWKSSERGIWVPAYWTTADGEKVVDVTGAGNSFLGGLAAGLVLSSGAVDEGTPLSLLPTLTVQS